MFDMSGTFESLFMQHKVITLMADDVDFTDGKLQCGVMNVPLNGAGEQWLCVTPLVQRLPAVAIDLDRDPISQRLFRSFKGTIRNASSDPLVGAWHHMQAEQHMVSSVLACGMQTFASRETPLRLVEEQGSKYCLRADGSVMIQTARGDCYSHVDYASLLDNPICVKVNDQESSMFALYCEQLTQGDRIIYFPDQCHVETRDNQNTCRAAELAQHCEKVTSDVPLSLVQIPCSEHVFIEIRQIIKE